MPQTITYSTRLIGLLLLVGVCLGCETVVDVELPSHESRLVVNSFFTPDSTWDVRLSATVAYTDTLFGRAPWVENGSVEIWNGGNLIEVLDHVGNGRYRGQTRPDVETEYFVRASAPEYSDVQGGSTIPGGTTLEAVSARFNRAPEGSGMENEIEFTVTIRDTPDLDNFYNIRVIQVFESASRGGATAVDSTYSVLFTNDLALVDDRLSGDTQYFYDKAYFTDELFRESSYDLRFSARLLGQAISFGDRYRFYVQLLNLSEDLYTYEITAAEQRGTDQDPFSESVDVYSNMSSGFGVFAGYHSEVVLVPVGSDE